MSVNVRATLSILSLREAEPVRQAQGPEPAAERRNNPSRNFRWIAAVGGASLLMNSRVLSLRARLDGRGNPSEIQLDDRVASLPAMTSLVHCLLHASARPWFALSQ